MTEQGNAGEARKGLIDSVKGKAKEVAGAVLGNDSLTTEGHLERTQAKERKEANREEAVADAEAAQARAVATEAKTEADARRREVSSESAAAKAAVHADQVTDEAAAVRTGERVAARQQTAAELAAEREIESAESAERQQAATTVEKLIDDVDEHRRTQRITRNAHDEADRIRERADQLTEDAELP
jgi:uncharacterized protein YjbJ (UPF0337 family)